MNVRTIPWRRIARRALLAAAWAWGLLCFWTVAVALYRARLECPGPTLLVLDRQGRFLGEVPEVPDGGRGYWPVEALPDRVAAATLAIEDRRFRGHPGVDPVAMGRALLQNLRSGRRVSGASTIAMQVARMQHPGRRSYLRKAQESLTAVFLTARYGRGPLLAHYLRIVPYGNRIRGIGYAARRYLDKPVEDLSWAETAFLVAIPQSPARMNPFDPDGRLRAVSRGQRILQRLRERGVLPEGEYALACRQIVQIDVPRPPSRPAVAMHAILRLDARLREEGLRGKLGGRPVVRTTLDLGIQELVAQRIRRSVEGWEALGAGNAAAVVLDRAGFDVLAYVGSAGYFDARRSGAIDYASIPRPAGSTLKPFLFAHALDRGRITPATILDDLPPGPGGIVNSDLAYMGPILPRVALANSRNVTAALLLRRIGLDEGYGFLAEVGLHDHRIPASRMGLSLATGSLPVTLEGLTRAYTTLAGDGRLVAPRWFEGEPLPEPRRVVSEDTARTATLFLSDPMARLPSFPRMSSLEYPFPVAVKTGTSQGIRDSWAIAWSARYLVGVWVGHPDARPMNGLTGFRSAARLAQDILMPLHRDAWDGLQDLPFPPPRGFAGVKLCALTGERATEACDRVLLEWLRRGEEPRDRCAAHVRLAVDTKDGRLATAATPRERVELRTFVSLPPRYAEWAAAHRLEAPPLCSGASGQSAPSPGESATRLEIVSPEDGARVLRDPETPAGMSSLALQVVADPPVPQVVWYVDGEPFRIADSPYAARWKLTPGRHTFQVRLPFAPARSNLVRVVVE